MSPIETMLEGVAWQEQAPPEVDCGIPYATHSGVLNLMGRNLRCFRLNDGRAIFDADDLADFFGALGDVEHASASNTRRDGPSHARER